MTPKDALWYSSAVLEAVALGFAISVRRELPWLMVWLLVDVLTQAIEIYAHLRGGPYQAVWESVAPVWIVTSIMAARECWTRLGGRAWVAASITLAAGIYLAVGHSLPHSLIEAEFAGIAITSAAVGLVLWMSILEAVRAIPDGRDLNYAFALCGYFLFTALICYVAPVERDTAGLLNEIVACLFYGAMMFVFLYRPARAQLNRTAQ